MCICIYIYIYINNNTLLRSDRSIHTTTCCIQYMYCCRNKQNHVEINNTVSFNHSLYVNVSGAYFKVFLCQRLNANPQYFASSHTGAWGPPHYKLMCSYVTLFI